MSSPYCYFCGQTPIHTIGECPMCQNKEKTRELLKAALADNARLTDAERLARVQLREAREQRDAWRKCAERLESVIRSTVNLDNDSVADVALEELARLNEGKP